MAGSTNVDVLRAALKDTEDELCVLGHTLVNQGWNTDSISMTLDVLRIALYGSDGRGNGLEHFALAQAELAALRADEAAKAD